MRLGSPYGSCFHTFLRIPHTASQLQKIRHQFRRDQRFRPRKPGIRRPPRIPCVDCRRGTTCPDWAPNPPRPAAGFPRIYTPTPFPQIPCSNDWGTWTPATTLRRRQRLEGQCLFALVEYRKAAECFDRAARPDSGCTTAHAGMVRSQKRPKKRLKRGRCLNGTAGPEPDCATAQPYGRCCAQSTPEA